MMISRKKFTIRYFLFFGLVPALILFYSVLSANEVAVIKVQYRKAAEMVPIVQTMLSAGGSVTVSQRVNSLVIVDNPEAIRRVYAYLERFDKPVEQVRIHVRFNTPGASEERAVAARGRYSKDNVSVAVGRKKKDGVDISGEDRGHRRNSTSSAFVVAMSGSPAFIRTGKEIPYRQGSDGGTVVWKNAESGFEITPIVVGDNVHLKIMPRLVYDHSKDGVIRLFGAQMELTTPFGQWVEIGGTPDQQNEIFREILSQSMGAGNSANTISIMVERP
jgi:hypothetical protein